MTGETMTNDGRRKEGGRMQKSWDNRLRLATVLLGMVGAIGLLLLAQQPPPPNEDDGETGQQSICGPPPIPPPPEWIKITDVWHSKRLRIEWKPATGATHYNLYRCFLSPNPCPDGKPYPVTQFQIISYRTTATSFIDNFDEYNLPTFYAVRSLAKRVVICQGLRPDCTVGQVREFWSESTSMTWCYTVMDKISVTDHASVDSRLDFRKNPIVFRNYRFGYSTYRGGLFVGFANDPSRISRIYLKFPFPSPPFKPDDAVWDASLLLFYTQAHESSTDVPSDQTQPHPVALKLYVAQNNDWGQRSIHWSNKPPISDPAFLLFEGSAYPGSWVEIREGKNPFTLEPRRFKGVVTNNVTVTYVLTMPDDKADYCLTPDPKEQIGMQIRWKYFAKREFKERWAPYVLRATGKQVPESDVCIQH